MEGGARNSFGTGMFAELLEIHNVVGILIQEFQTTNQSWAPTQYRRVCIFDLFLLARLIRKI